LGYRGIGGQVPNSIKDKEGFAKPRTDNNADLKSLRPKDGLPAREKALVNGKIGRIAVAGRRGRTLTATLTARSEVK
jgi:hypothetical protein